MQRMKRIAAGLLAACLLPVCAGMEAQAQTETADLQSIADGIIRWKKLDNGSTPDGPLINDTFLELAGSTPGDWFPIGLGRLGRADAFDSYLAVIKDVVQERYKEPGKLSAAKATEWHRISLAVLAAGGDPTGIGIDESGQPINLIADGTYDRGKTTSLGRQGINGWIWGLIALDAKRYPVPEGAFYSRDDLITEILRQQLADGGFALSGREADPDITAMALQALAPYYNSEKTYAYKQKVLERDVRKTVRQVADEALACLSAAQTDDGDFKSWGTRNVESTNQVTVALCALGIDPLADARFIKKGNTLLDGILLYRMEDGGFVHSFTYDPENPTSKPDESNTMASEQTLYTMAALIRQRQGLRTLYDFRPEQSAALKKRIADVRAGIAGITGKTAKAQLQELLTAYYSLPEGERSYVPNYWALADAARGAGVDVEAVAGSTPVVESPGDGEGSSPILMFTAADKAQADALPPTMTTEQYVTVTRLLDKLENAEDFDGREAYRTKLTAARDSVAAIQAEIDALNADVLEKLYPFDALTLADKPTVDAIVNRYEALSPYDRAKIDRWEDVVKSKTKLDNLLRGLVIAGILCAAAAGVTVVAALHIRKRRLQKRRAMEELAAQYVHEDEDAP